MRRSIMFVFVLLAGCAESGPLESARVEISDRTEIEAHLYPSELVLDHQNEIGLTEAQRAHILEALQSTQRAIVEVEFTLRSDREQLARVLSNARVDEAEVTPIAERVANGERELKLHHLRLLVRIKNELTPEQQRRLDRLR